MNLSFQFADPALLWLLLLLPIVSWWKGKKGSPIAVKMPSIDDALMVGARTRSRAGSLMFFLSLLSLTLLILALARPRFSRGTTDVDSKGIDIMLTLDVSGSMEAMDFTLDNKQVNRLEVIKNVVEKFIETRTNDRIGMVAFAGRPYMAAPLTHDQAWVTQRLQDVQIGQVEDGTAIGILLTDGVNNAGAVNPLTAAEAAKALGIKVYTIGAGTNGEAPFPARDMFGGVHMQKIKVEIDEKMLTEIADSTGGKYFRATDTDSLEKIYDTINQLETTERKISKYEDFDELFLWFLSAGLFLLLLEFILNQTKFRRLP
jgi:Ca-activated chloride channel family protein